MNFRSMSDALVHIKKSARPLALQFGEILHLLQKDGIAPTDLAVGGTLTASRAKEVRSAIYDESPFLKKVSRQDMSSLIEDMMAITLGVGNLVRHTNGTEPSTFVKPTEVGKKLYALQLDLFWQVLLHTVVEFKSIADINSFIRGEMAKAFSNEILNLGFVGVNDDYAGSAYTKLNKGWLYLAKASASSHKVDISNVDGVDVTDSQIQIFKTMLAALPDKWKGEELVFVCPYAAHEDYQYEIANLGGAVLNANVLMSALADNFMKRKIDPVSYCPARNYLLSPYKNFVHGIAEDVKNYSETRMIKGSWDNRSVIFNDYEWAFDDAVVVGYDI